jgi:hypothetical protein
MTQEKGCQDKTADVSTSSPQSTGPAGKPGESSKTQPGIDSQAYPSPPPSQEHTGKQHSKGLPGYRHQIPGKRDSHLSQQASESSHAKCQSYFFRDAKFISPSKGIIFSPIDCCRYLQVYPPSLMIG